MLAGETPSVGIGQGYVQVSPLQEAVAIGGIAADGRIYRPYLDANRIMLTGGPKGPGKTKDVGQVIAGVDPVAIDAYGTTLFGMKPTDIKHIQLAHELGVGEIDLTKVKIKQV